VTVSLKPLPLPKLFQPPRFRITAGDASGHIATSPKYIKIFIFNMALTNR
jgi:hypothetical protein